MEQNIKTIDMLVKESEINSHKNVTTAAKNIETIDEVIVTMDRIQKEMLWNIVCENNRKLNRLEEKVDRILKILGDHYGTE